MPYQLKPLRAERTVILMTVLTLIGQFLALVREAAIAAEFGASSLTDSFLLAIMIPNAILLLVQNGLLMALIPVLAELVTREGEEKAWLSASNLINLTMLLLVAASVIILAVAEPVVSLLAPSLPECAHNQVVHMMRTLISVNILGGLGALLGGILNVNRIFTPPVLFNLLLNVVTIAGVLLLAASFSIWALVIGTVTAYAVQGILLMWNLRPIHRYRWVLNIRDPAVPQVARLVWPATLTLALQQGIVFVDRAVALPLGAGHISALNFSSKLVLAGAPLLIGALSTIALPELSRAVAEDSPERVKSITLSLLRYALFLGTPVASILYVLRRPVTFLAFQRGAFDAEATDLTSALMGFYSITLLAVCLREIAVRFFYASQDTVTPLVTGGIRTLLNAWLDLRLARIMQSRGIALANAIAISADVLIMLIILLRRWRIQMNLNYPLKIGAATISLVMLSRLMLQFSGTLVNLMDHLQAIFLAATVGGISYWLTSLALNVAESKFLMTKGFRFVKSPRRQLP